MIFRQLVDAGSSTYTYLLGCPQTCEAILLDPVLEAIERDLAVLRAFSLRLAFTLETHIHADHLSSAWVLRDRTGCQVAYPATEMVACSDVQVAEDRPFCFGHLTLLPLHTPGHTAGSYSYFFCQEEPPMLFTGDALLIDGCGRTDLQGGDAAVLYRSIHQKIFTLPDDTLVYPGHDYNQRRVSTVAQERARNQRLGNGKTIEEFVAIMADLSLPYPKKMDVALPANRSCGRRQGCRAVHGGAMSTQPLPLLCERGSSGGGRLP
jgi:glyoxylase-like metal-dependent hydrolase (beta-lactamase superfamily II)